MSLMMVYLWNTQKILMYFGYMFIQQILQLILTRMAELALRLNF
jgi:hypothetical protein